MASGRGTQAGRETYEKNLDIIRDVIQFVCGRLQFHQEEKQEFTSWVHVKLLDDKTYTLEKFRGECEFRTYLVAVLLRWGVDYRRERWGKWRNSRAALRLGPVATLLETLVVRDQRSFEEAVEILRINHHVSESLEELEKLLCQFPNRAGRRFERLETIAALPSPEPSPEATIMESEAKEQMAQVCETLRSAMKNLTPEQRVILKLFFADGFSWKEISDSLGYAQRSLYSTKNRALAMLKDALKARGLSGRTVLRSLGSVEGDSIWGGE